MAGLWCAEEGGEGYLKAVRGGLAPDCHKEHALAVCDQFGWMLSLS